MNNKTDIEEHCICTTCNNKECINHNCKFDCASEEMCNCTIDGYTDQCSDYKADIEEDIKILKNALKCNKQQFEEIGTHILLQEDEQQAIENILANRERVLEENRELARENFRLKTELENKQKEYQETYKDVREELKKLQVKANKYDALVEKIKEAYEDLTNMEVDGEVFTTAVNFARNQIQELIPKEE